MRKLLVFVVVVLACSSGCSDHDEGVRQGREAARKARGENGEIGAKVQGVVVENYPGKVDDKKSSEWNAGYREGFKKELKGK
jgi:hypothetical protein